MTPLDYYFWGAVIYKCYADKPETIDALKDNIHEAIGGIQLHTIDNVLENWTDRVGYRMANRMYFQIKKKFEKIFSSFFLSIFQKKGIWRTR